ncbi:MAG: ABC transporter permease [Clostridium sp.]|nr:ABC transporter permease [Clostridium sp.]
MKNQSRREEWKQHLFAIRELTGREIKRKYARSRLGILWSVLNPLLSMAVMSLIFSTMFRRSIENYPIYNLTGSILWTLFSGGTNTAMTALVDNKTLLLRVRLPKQLFVFSRIYTALINFGYTCVAYAAMLIIFRIRPTVYMLLFPLDVLLLLLFTMGISYILSVCYVFFADVKYLYSIVLTLWMYLSALFYPVEGLSVWMQRVLGINPVYLSVAIARGLMMYGVMPDAVLWIRLSIAAVLSFVIGYGIFKKFENRVMQYI